MINYSVQDDVAILMLDDGKANALSHDMMDELARKLDEASSQRSVVIAGRPGKFCAGFDLKYMMQGKEQAVEMVSRGCGFMADLMLYPRPIVMACTGHARAGGALMLLCADHRIGVGGPFGIGMNELEIGIPLPTFALEMLRFRLDPRQLAAATLGATIYDPEAAQTAGFLDEVVTPDALVPRALEVAAKLGRYNAASYAKSKELMRKPLADAIRGTVETDLKDWVPGAL